MRRVLYISLLFIIVVCCAARVSAGEPESMTVELDGRAVLLYADTKILDEIETMKHEGFKGIETADDFIELIKNRFGNDIKYEVFVLPGVSDMSEVYKTTVLPLREAVLRGIIPPVEGLDASRADRVLTVFGFKTLSSSEMEKMSEQERGRMLYLSEGTIVILTNTEPFSEIIIYEMYE